MASSSDVRCPSGGGRRGCCPGCRNNRDDGWGGEEGPEEETIVLVAETIEVKNRLERPACTTWASWSFWQQKKAQIKFELSPSLGKW